MNRLGIKALSGLHVGLEGKIFGGRGRVVGRSLLRSVDGYRWEEYHLKMDDGSLPTLVYESGIWKRFDLFTPSVPLSAEEAQKLGVGDIFSTDGEKASVSYVGRSTVTFTEGEPPEGYRNGSKARYFNAEAGGRMYVVSWTGSEVEFYRGVTLARGEVERAFGLSPPSLLFRLLVGGSGDLDSWFDSNHRLGAALLLAAVLFGVLFALDGGPIDPTVAPPPPIPVPALAFTMGAQGVLDGVRYTITGSEASEVAEMQGRFGRREYELTDPEGAHLLLLQGLVWNARQWFLLRPLERPAYLYPSVAATYRMGSLIKVDGHQGQIRTLFVARTTSSQTPLPPSGLVRFGFAASSESGWILARWSETDLELYFGKAVPEPEVLRAFGPGLPR